MRSPALRLLPGKTTPASPYLPALRDITGVLQPWVRARGLHRAFPFHHHFLQWGNGGSEREPVQTGALHPSHPWEPLAQPCPYHLVSANLQH